MGLDWNHWIIVLSEKLTAHSQTKNGKTSVNYCYPYDSGIFSCSSVPHDQKWNKNNSKKRIVRKLKNFYQTIKL